MYTLITQLRRDEQGALAVDVILHTTIMALGIIAGLTTFRDQIVQYMGDTAVAIDALDQSFSITVNGTDFTFADTPTLSDPAPSMGVSGAPAGIEFVEGAAE